MPSRKKQRKKRKSPGSKVSAVKSSRKDPGHYSPRPAAGKQRGIAGFAAEISRLIVKGKNKAAVSKAKQYHKSTHTKESEKILVDAYIGRIREMALNGYIVEGKALLELVRNRYNCSDHRLTELNAVFSVREGKIDELVHPLTDPGISLEKCTAIEKTIKNELTDLGMLTRCNVLSSDHPLKTGALAAAKAFAKVTSGLVADDDIALPAISRRSPLAPWKMLIKALACFYRHDDELCEKYLQAVDPESAPARLVSVIRELAADKSNGSLSGSSALLAEKVTGNGKKIRRALQMLDTTLIGKKPQKLFAATRDAVNICQQSCPELIDRLKQHISIRSWMNGIEAEDVNRALGGPSLKNAYFWQLHALAAEIKGNYLFACALWEEFRKHALHEGWLSAKSKAVSVIYLLMADLLKRQGTENFEWDRWNFKRGFKGFQSYYHNQPQSVLEAVQQDKQGASATYFLYPDHLYRLASEIDPAPETFRQWLDWIENDNSHWKESDAVALAWHTAVPDDARPLVFLMKSAEKRNAFKKALGYLAKAERLDGLNPDVKKAELRLLTATAIRHLKQKKSHLAQKDVSHLEVMAQVNEGDRLAFLVALKSVCATIDSKESKADRLNDELIKLLGNKLTAKMIMDGLLTACGLPVEVSNFRSYSQEPLEGNVLVAAVTRGCKLGDDMGVAVNIPWECKDTISDFIATKECTLDTVAIRIIAEAALRNEHFKLAYASAGAGLWRGGATTAGFLLIRARSLPAWEMTRRNDCITAAIELARRERDMDLIDEAIELRRNGEGSPIGFSIWNHILREGNFSMEAEELNDVLQREKETHEYPSSKPENFLNRFDYDEDLEDSQCKNCDAEDCPDRETGYAPDNVDDFDDDDYFDASTSADCSMIRVRRNGSLRIL